MDEEVWLPVPGYDGLMASSWGRYQLPPKLVIRGTSKPFFHTKKPTYGTWDPTTNRYVANLTQWQKFVKVHQIVCLAFHGPKPFPEALVMHLDENSRNNRPDNLSWGTQKQNLNAPGFLAHCRGRTGDKNPRVKGIRKRRERHSTPTEEEQHEA